jgi:hypothetical protein
MSPWKPPKPDFIDLTASSDEERGEPAWRVERRMRSVARLALRVRREETPPPADDPPPRQRRESSSLETDTTKSPEAAASDPMIGDAAKSPQTNAAASDPPKSDAPESPQTNAAKSRVVASVAPPKAVVDDDAARADAVRSEDVSAINNKKRHNSARGGTPDQPDDLYRAWHGDSSHVTSSDATQRVYFDWVSVRKRANRCRSRLEQAAGEMDGEEIRTSEPNDEGNGAANDHAETTDDGYIALRGEWVGYFRHLKTCWVTTHTNGVATKEWRQPAWQCPAVKTQSDNSSLAKPPAQSPPKSAKVKSPLEPAKIKSPFKSGKVNSPSKPVKAESTPKKGTAPASRALLYAAVHEDAKSEAPTNREARRSRKGSKAIVRRFPRYSPPPLQFVDKRWPSGIICLGQMFNPLDIKFRFDSPFVGDCECADLCRYGTCPNGILGMFCSPACCSQSDRCGNSLKEHDSLRLVRRRGSSELAVIATAKIAAGEALGEYRGELQAVKKKPPVVSGQQVTHPVERNGGYRYKMKRASETHPSHDIYVDAEHMGGITRFMNHSCAANCVFQEMRNGRVHTAVVVTTRGVLPGEEVTVHYGQDLWFICRCGEASCQHRDIQHLENPF